MTALPKWLGPPSAGEPSWQPGAVVSLLQRPGCHLCADVEPVIAATCAELGLTWEVVSILDVPQLLATYADQIPVTLIDGRVHDYWRLDPARFRAALSARA